MEENTSHKDVIVDRDLFRWSLIIAKELELSEMVSFQKQLLPVICHIYIQRLIVNRDLLVYIYIYTDGY